MLPNLVIIGAMKCGTTSLRYYLDKHPAIRMAHGNLNFFVEERNWRRGLDWYRPQFDPAAHIRGDTSPRYTNHPINAGVAEKMHALLPDAKLIYLVRDPVERLISHYRHAYAEGEEDRSLAEALAGFERDPELNPYVCRSLYQLQLDRYLALYPPSQLLLIHQEDLRDHRRDTLRSVFRFLGVDDSFDSPRFDAEQHRTADKRRWTPLGRRLLKSPAFTSLATRSPAAERILRRGLEWGLADPVPRPVLAPELCRRLKEVFTADLERPPALTARYVRRWRSPQAD